MNSGSFRTCLILLVLTLSTPISAQVPTPAEVIGFDLGADYKLADYDQILTYFEKLAEASDRVVVEEVGKSTLGRPMIIALISSKENIGNLDRYKEISRRLALVKGTTVDEAKNFAKEGKTIVWVDSGLHASEVAHGQHAPLLAHWLATDESDEARHIRENVILLLMPNLNPDGLDTVVKWYEKNLGTPFETAPMPELYHEYVGHDNNRDSDMFSQVETQVAARVYFHEWFPQILYCPHQTGPFPGRIWVPPYRDPVNPNLDPLLVNTINEIGEHMKKRFAEEGKPGAHSSASYDLWWSGYLAHVAMFHNMAAFHSETNLYRYATPHNYEADKVPDNFPERSNFLPAKIPTISLTDPWLGGDWNLSHAVDYILTSSKAVLDIGAELKEDYLFNIYRMGKRQIERAERAEGGPFAYVIDLNDQHDRSSAVEMLRIFRLSNIELRQAEGEFQAGDQRFSAGSYVVPPQAFWPWVVDVMDTKKYPERFLYPGGPPERPYDVTGYEHPLKMGVTVHRIKEPFTVPPKVVEKVDLAPPPGTIEGSGSYGYLLAPEQNAAIVATNRLLAGGATVEWTTESAELAGRSWNAGTRVIRDADGNTVEGLARELGLDFHAIASAPDVGLQQIRAPKVGLYKTYVANMDEGWIRFLLEKRYGFDYDTLYDKDIRDGNLTPYDVIILPDQDTDGLQRGHAPDTMPPEYAGGLGVEGAAALKRYVADGGWLLAVDRAVDFVATQLGLPIKTITQGDEFYIPGSLINIEVDTSTLLACGMSEKAVASFWRTSYVYDIIPAAKEGEKKAERDIVTYANYAKEDFMASGWEIGAEKNLAGKPAAFQVPFGKGQVVLIGFRPHFRSESHNTFKLLFNPLYASTVAEH